MENNLREDSEAINYRSIPVSTLRALPIRQNRRLQVLGYRLTQAPGHGGSGPVPTHNYGSVRLAEGYILAISMKKVCGEWCLEVEQRAYDEVLGQREAPEDTDHAKEWSPQILADIFRLTQAKIIAADAADYSRKAGRN